MIAGTQHGGRPGTDPSPGPCVNPRNPHSATPAFARSTFDLFAIVKQIVDAKAQFRSLAEPWADTGTSTGRLMIAVLGGLADVERDLIRTRTAEGRSRATKRGQRMGRKPKLTEAQQAEARKRRAEGATLVELARSYGVGKSTISRLQP
jgi:DNA invertase Pin-like site-specific DNA recombinase